MVVDETPEKRADGAVSSIVRTPRFVRCRAALARMRAHKLRTALTAGVIILTALCMLPPLVLATFVIGDTVHLTGAPRDPGCSLLQVYPEMATASWAWGADGNGPLHVASSDARRVYELRPNATISGVPVTNSDGFRDHEFSTDKPAGTYRIVVIGDSVTFGWWEKVSETYPKVLESLLNAEGGGTRFEVYNMAVGGYNSEQEAELLKTRAFAFHPDLIIVGYCANDSLHADAGQWKHFYGSKHSAWACRADILETDLGAFNWLLTGRGLVTRAYVDMQRSCSEHRVPLLVVVFPSEDLYFLCSKAERVFRSMGLDVLSLKQEFLAVGWEKVAHSDGLHPNVLGHSIAAKRIFEYLKSNYIQTARNGISAP